MSAAGLDRDSRQWVEQLRVGHPQRDRTVGTLHDALRRVAVYELSRRRHQLRSVTGPEFDDLAQQAADDALVNVLNKLDDFRGLSRFTTWAYKFVIFEVSAKVARHAWRRQPPGVEELAWDEVSDPLTPRPEDRLEQRAQLDALSRAIGELTGRQREVFVAIALNEALGLVFVYAHFRLLAGVAAFGEGTKLAVVDAAKPALGAGARWALAGGIGAFALSLAVIHIGAEWTSLRDRTFLGRLGLAGLAIALAAAGGEMPPLAFTGVIAVAVLGQLLLEAATPRTGAASVVARPGRK